MQGEVVVDLSEGQRVSFVPVQGPKGIQAGDVRLLYN
jgi:cold shock CspA family protein